MDFCWSGSDPPYTVSFSTRIHNVEIIPFRIERRLYIQKLCIFVGQGCLRLCSIPVCNTKFSNVARFSANSLHFIGLTVAVLADSTRWGVVAKTFIFVPMAISFVGAAVIWRNIFAGGGIEAQEAINGMTPSYQIGLLKHLLGHGPDYNEPLYALRFWGNFFDVDFGLGANWICYGHFFGSTARVPEDTIEAATIDGANPFQMFFRIKLPQIFSTVLVVWTTLVILVLKVFDIPYALSANDDDKLLLATMMENARNNWSVGGDNVDNLFAAIAIMLMLTVVPNMAFNAWRIRKEQREMGH